MKGFIMSQLMTTRDVDVLNMQLVLIPILSEAWHKTYRELSILFDRFDVLRYIEACYEEYNSTGEQGIIDDLKEYIEIQGGVLE